MRQVNESTDRWSVVQMEAELPLASKVWRANGRRQEGQPL